VSRQPRQPVDPHCSAFQSAIDVLGRPWNALILGVLHGGALRFGELSERSHGCGPKTLSARLKDLCARGLVARVVEAGPPVRVHYSLTPKGQAFEHVAEAIETWGRALVADDARSTGKRASATRAQKAKRSPSKRSAPKRSTEDTPRG
jgi:DNA-binding HxlR family transcriptional regulator